MCNQLVGCSVLDTCIIDRQCYWCGDYPWGCSGWQKNSEDEPIALSRKKTNIFTADCETLDGLGHKISDRLVNVTRVYEYTRLYMDSTCRPSVAEINLCWISQGIAPLCNWVCVSKELLEVAITQSWKIHLCMSMIIKDGKTSKGKELNGKIILESGIVAK